MSVEIIIVEPNGRWIPFQVVVDVPKGERDWSPEGVLISADDEHLLEKRSGGGNELERQCLRNRA